MENMYDNFATINAIKCTLIAYLYDLQIKLRITKIEWINERKRGHLVRLDSKSNRSVTPSIEKIGFFALIHVVVVVVVVVVVFVQQSFLLQNYFIVFFFS